MTDIDGDRLFGNLIRLKKRITDQKEAAVKMKGFADDYLRIVIPQAERYGSVDRKVIHQAQESLNICAVQLREKLALCMPANHQRMKVMLIALAEVVMYARKVIARKRGKWPKSLDWIGRRERGMEELRDLAASIGVDADKL